MAGAALLPDALLWAVLVVAAGAGGAIALRPSSSRARGPRLVAVVGLALLALLPESGVEGFWLVPLGVLPAIGVADTVALQLEAARGR